MDALDIQILRALGMEPFAAWPRRHVGLRISDVARRLGRNIQFVKDRIARMEKDGVIVGYHLFPNLHHLDLRYTVLRWRVGFVPDSARLSRLDSVDGFAGVVWGLDSSLCLELTHADHLERDRRVGLMQALLDDPSRPQTFYERTFPQVPRRLSDLDWRIIHALQADARRPLSDVAKALGVTAKTVRTRHHAMWQEGSIDTYAALNFSKIAGVVLFQLAIWHEPEDAGVPAQVLRHFHDRCLDHFQPPSDGYCSFLVRVFAYTPAEVQALVREAMALEGVTKAEPALATGAFYNDGWLPEVLGRKVRLVEA